MRAATGVVSPERLSHVRRRRKRLHVIDLIQTHRQLSYTVFTMLMNKVTCGFIRATCLSDQNTTLENWGDSKDRYNLQIGE